MIGGDLNFSYLIETRSASDDPWKSYDYCENVDEAAELAKKLLLQHGAGNVRITMEISTTDAINAGIFIQKGGDA